MKITGFRNLPIRIKLLSIIAVSAATALLLAHTVNLFYHQSTVRTHLVHEIDAMARVVANRSTAALLFQDQQIAGENLEALATLDAVQSACMYAADGGIFAHYSRESSLQRCPERSQPAGVRFGSSSLFFSRVIVFDNEEVGALYIEAGLAGVQKATLDYLTMAVIAFIGAIAIALLLSHWLQRLISDPITRLAKTASRISSTRDYSLRAKKDREDETGHLVDAFNSMLETVRERNSQLKASEARYRDLIEGLPALSYTADPERRITYYASPQIAEILGISASEWTDNPGRFLDSLHPEDRLRVRETLTNSWKSGEAFYCEYRIRHQNGRYLWVSDEARMVKDETTRSWMRRGMMHDITERKEHELAQRQAAAFFRNTTEGVIITDEQARVLDVNEAYTRITGRDKDTVIGQPLNSLHTNRRDKRFFTDIWNSLQHHESWRGEILDQRVNGETFPAWLTISAVHDETGKAINYVGVLSDISAIKESQQKLDHLAHHDPLTNLPNRLLFSDRLSHALDHAERNLQQLAVMFVDLDRFKEINDSLGHAVGDQLLQEVAYRFAYHVRQEDTIARIGGDEFLVIMEQLSHESDASLVAQKLLDSLAGPFHVDEQEFYISASIGISLYPRDGKDVDSLVKNADAAMYRAKEQGRNNCQFYTRELTRSARHRVQLATSLRHALIDEQFQLHYQPQVNLQGQGNAIVGMEALLRWRHPEHGLVPPAQFIPQTEESGLIVPIGEWLLGEACQQALRWQQAGFDFGRIAVNVSGKQIDHPNFTHTVENIIAESGLDPALLELEVTESFIMGRAAFAADVLERLKAIGVSIAIDDFGTGYSSLAYLKKLPVDTLKIDREFVRDLPHDANDEAISKAIIALGKSLQLQIVAEGIETPQQAQFLQQAGCDVGQGYLYGKPCDAEEYLPAEEVPRRMAGA